MTNPVVSDGEQLIHERGLSVLGGGKGYLLLGIKGLDWAGPAYEWERSHYFPKAHEEAASLVRDGTKGFRLVWGNEETPKSSWPIWARFD